MNELHYLLKFDETDSQIKDILLRLTAKFFFNLNSQKDSLFFTFINESGLSELNIFNSDMNWWITTVKALNIWHQCKNCFQSNTFGERFSQVSREDPPVSRKCRRLAVIEVVQMRYSVHVPQFLGQIYFINQIK